MLLAFLRLTNIQCTLFHQLVGEYIQASDLQLFATCISNQTLFNALIEDQVVDCDLSSYVLALQSFGMKFLCNCNIGIHGIAHSAGSPRLQQALGGIIGILGKEFQSNSPSGWDRQQRRYCIQRSHQCQRVQAFHLT